MQTLRNVIHAVAGALTRRPDRSLVNEKFTDSLERRLAGRAQRTIF
jgi:hypothetical protein